MSQKVKLYGNTLHPLNTRIMNLILIDVTASKYLCAHYILQYFERMASIIARQHKH